METRHTYWLTRYVILRLLGLVYAIAFAVAINQIVPLIGENGLIPVGYFMNRLNQAYGSSFSSFLHLPSIFWLNHADQTLKIAAWIGFILSCVVLSGYSNALILFTLWFLYMSFVHVGEDWYGYGWEIQLLETGFLAIFLCPLWDIRPFPKRPAPFPILMLFRFLIFRVMLGSGMIKIRGDQSWRNATALYYHFETQPIPGPLSRWFHFLPKGILQLGVWYNFLAELVAPWFIFWPRIGRLIAGAVIVILQIILIFSGNLSFLNWLTIIPALACFDDRFLAKILPRYLVNQANSAESVGETSRSMTITTWIVTCLVAILSFQPLINILSPSQIMNTSFDPLDLVNTYGAFGSVGENRFNLVFEGCADDTTSGEASWKEYIYKGLPVELNKRPPQIAPYQLRLDWQLWFAAMSTPEEYPWVYNLIYKLLQNDQSTLGLFASDPFPNARPKFIRVELYKYKFVNSKTEPGKWWDREKISEWIPAISADNPELVKFLKDEGYLNN